jgi:hypothetical protein
MKKPKLPAGVLFHHDLQLLVYRPRGVLNEKIVNGIVAYLDQAEDKADKPFNRFTDLSKLKAIELDMEYVCRVSLHRRQRYLNYPPVKSAFYVTAEKAAAIATAHAVITDQSPLQVAVFTEVAAAAKWLGVSTADLRIGER